MSKADSYLATTYQSLVDQQVCRCKNYYCTTCGGMYKLFMGIRFKVLSDIDTVVQEFKSVELLELSTRDFKDRNKHSYPSEQNVALYVSFLLGMFDLIPAQLKIKVLDCWVKDCDKWPDWFFDALSYYFVPLIPNNKSWLPLLMNRAENSVAIAETKRLKYGELC